MLERFHSYLDSFDLQDLLKELKLENKVKSPLNRFKQPLIEELKERDLSLITGLGRRGMEVLFDSILESLTPLLGKKAPDILHVGSGTGWLTGMMVDRIKRILPNANFFAMDMFPGLLKILLSRREDVVPIVGLLEGIRGSLLYSSRYFALPDSFDAIISILTLHHVKDVERALLSMKEALRPEGIAIIVDLCKHEFKEFRREMGDIHLGFDPSNFQGLAAKHFPRVLVERIRGLSYKSSNKSIELFKAVLSL